MRFNSAILSALQRGAGVGVDGLAAVVTLGVAERAVAGLWRASVRLFCFCPFFGPRTPGAGRMPCSMKAAIIASAPSLVSDGPKWTRSPFPCLMMAWKYGVPSARFRPMMHPRGSSLKPLLSLVRFSGVESGFRGRFTVVGGPPAAGYAGTGTR